jgi:hypothetical protein
MYGTGSAGIAPAAGVPWGDWHFYDKALMTARGWRTVGA